MAIYHASIKAFSRGKGESSVAAAAYRAGIDLIDTTKRIEHRYSQRKGVSSYHMLAPFGAPAWCRDPKVFWDANEAWESRANARVARELEVSLPSELSDEQRKRLALALGQQLVDRFKAVVLVAIHAPSGEGDQRNHHVHLLMSARQVGPQGLGERAGAEFEARQGKGAEVVREVREWVGEIINEHLALAGHALRVDHRSLKEQAVAAVSHGDLERAASLNRAPSKHIGKAKTWMARKSAGNDAHLSVFGVQPEEALADAAARAAEEGRLMATPAGHSHAHALRDAFAEAVQKFEARPPAAAPSLTRMEARRRSWPRMTAEPSPVALRLAKGARLARAQGRDAELLNAEADLIEAWLETQREVGKNATEALTAIPGIQFEPEFTAAAQALIVQRSESYWSRETLYEDTEALTRAIRDYAVAMRDPHDARVALKRARDRVSQAENETGRSAEAATRSARRALVRAKNAVSPAAQAAQDKQIREARTLMVEATERLETLYPARELELAAIGEPTAVSDNNGSQRMNRREFRPGSSRGFNIGAPRSPLH
jgi:hypothetical protein